MNVFELFAKISIDSNEYEGKLNDLEGKTSKVGSVLSTVGKVGAAAFGAAATAVGALTKQATSAYGEYEQLKGGIETLFGSSAQKVMADAEQAFNTAGLSMNQYMEQSIQGAGALIKALGSDTDKAAELMNVSIIDMADNVNKMGTNMEMVQNAYRGFSRGNFTMLDNLSLGFAGTKAGMQELLEKAEQISHVKYDINSYADIIQAIHVVQEEMGISGTTAKEAAGTIQGSLNSVKAAWQNLVTGLGNPDADLGKLIETVVETATAALKNLVPTIERVLKGIGDALNQLAPIISENLPKLADEILPSLLEAAGQLVTGLVKALPNILKALLKEIPNIINTLVNAIIESLPLLVEAALQIIIAIANGIADNLDKLVPAIVETIMKIVETILQNLPKILDAALEIIKALAKGILKALPILIKELPKIIKGIVDFIVGAVPEIVDAAIELFMGFVQAIPDIIIAIVEALPQIIDGIIEALLDPENLAKMMEAGVKLITALLMDIPKIIIELIAKLPEIVEGIINGFVDAFNNGDFARAGKALVDGLLRGIFSNRDSFLYHLGKFFGLPMELFRRQYEIKSPSRAMMRLGRQVSKGLAIGIDDNADEIIKNAQAVSDGLYDALNQDYGMSARMNRITSQANAFSGAQDGYLGGSDDEYEEIIIPRDSDDSGRDLTVVLELDRMQLGRAVYRLNKEETQRVGVELAGGLA